jgi:hypothetical protein
MAGPEKARRQELLNRLARELRRPGGPDVRQRRTLRLIPYLSVRRAGRGRLRVYCAGAGGSYGYLTGDGQLISLGDGVAGAAREVAAACGRPAGRTAPRTAGQPGS